MKTTKQPKASPIPKSKRSATNAQLPNMDEFVPRPAFRPFSLEDECHGRRRMRRWGKCIDSAKLAPNSLAEINVLYMEGLKRDCIKWELN